MTLHPSVKTWKSELLTLKGSDMHKYNTDTQTNTHQYKYEKFEKTKVPTHKNTHTQTYIKRT